MHHLGQTPQSQQSEELVKSVSGAANIKLIRVGQSAGNDGLPGDRSARFGS